MDIVYNSFTDLVKNCKYVSENFCNIAGQGLVNTYDIIVLGTGKNIYTLRFLDDTEERHTFKTVDNFITKLRLIMTLREPSDKRPTNGNLAL